MKKLKHITLFENFGTMTEVTYSELDNYIEDIITTRNNEILYIQTDNVSRTIARLNKDYRDILILDLNTFDISENYDFLNSSVILVGDSLDNVNTAISNKFTQVYLID